MYFSTNTILNSEIERTQFVTIKRRKNPCKLKSIVNQEVSLFYLPSASFLLMTYFWNL